MGARLVAHALAPLHQEQAVELLHVGVALPRPLVGLRCLLLEAPLSSPELPLFTSNMLRACVIMCRVMR